MSDKREELREELLKQLWDYGENAEEILKSIGLGESEPQDNVGAYLVNQLLNAREEVKNVPHYLKKIEKLDELTDNLEQQLEEARKTHLKAFIKGCEFTEAGAGTDRENAALMWLDEITQNQESGFYCTEHGKGNERCKTQCGECQPKYPSQNP